MKAFLIIFCLFNIMSCNDAATVYVCSSKNARKYHYKANCRGLSDCQYHIKKIAIGDAIHSNKTLCDWERPATH